MVRGLLRRHLPSMFERRLLLLVAVAVLVSLAIGAQTLRLTTGQAHQRYRHEARQALRTSEYIPTVRGRILDREGRVLARTEAGWDLKVDYTVITGEWAKERARDRALEDAGHRWSQLSDAQRQQRIEAQVQDHRDQVERLWQTLTKWRKAQRPAFSRGDLNRRKRRIEDRVQGVASHLWAIWQKRRQQKLGEKVSLEEVAKPIREQTRAHVILPDISEAIRRKLHTKKTRARNGRASSVWHEVKLDRPKQRRYPFESMTLAIDGRHLPRPLRKDGPIKVTVRGVGSHLLGRMRDVWKSDLEGADARPFQDENEAGQLITDLGGYRPGDRIGAFGLEAAYEHRLRGVRGKDVHHLDARGEDPIDIKPKAGLDVTSTVDIKLQARVQAIMSPATGLMEVQPYHIRDKKNEDRIGEPLTGAAVVMDTRTSEVLASVSIPAMPRETLRRHPERVFKDPYTLTYLNRPIAASHPPGSTVKPLMLAAAASTETYELGNEIFCRGYLNEDQPNAFRCWIWKQYNTGHGSLGPAASLKRSCNVFYYTLGRRLGLDRVVDWYSRFGLGRDTSVALTAESAGSLPDPDRRASAERDATLMGIGQGPITWTPLQAATAYSTLVRGGRYVGPTLVKPKHRRSARPSKRLELNSNAVAEAMHGLFQVVNSENGTGRQLHLDEPEPIFDVDHLRVFGKSGTADAGDRWIDKNLNQKQDEGEIIENPGDHAWFMAMPQAKSHDRPRYAIAVVVEYGGSGSQVAGPIANQIVHALIEEGYLPEAGGGAS